MERPYRLIVSNKKRNSIRKRRLLRPRRKKRSNDYLKRSNYDVFTLDNDDYGRIMIDNAQKCLYSSLIINKPYLQFHANHLTPLLSWWPSSSRSLDKTWYNLWQRVYSWHSTRYMRVSVQPKRGWPKAWIRLRSPRRESQIGPLRRWYWPHDDPCPPYSSTVA